MKTISTLMTLIIILIINISTVGQNTNIEIIEEKIIINNFINNELKINIIELIDNIISKDIYNKRNNDFILNMMKKKEIFLISRGDFTNAIGLKESHNDPNIVRIYKIMKTNNIQNSDVVNMMI